MSFVSAMKKTKARALYKTPFAFGNDMSVIISIRFIMFQLQDFAMIEGHLNS
jgi:hypothetical protein